jgi:hypothetical protein
MRSLELGGVHAPFEAPVVSEQAGVNKCGVPATARGYRARNSDHHAVASASSPATLVIIARAAA